MSRKILPLHEEYFDWLVNNRLGGEVSKKYTKLCYELNQKNFEWTVHNDDNRCNDGLQLRDTFVEPLDRDHLEVKYFLKARCTVLEVLIALAQRISDNMQELGDQRNHNSRWFLEMIKNLELDVYTDSKSSGELLSEMDATKISDVLERFMDRTYDYNGYGGLFPLKRRPPTNQKDVEIWYQLMLYLDENYG